MAGFKNMLNPKKTVKTPLEEKVEGALSNPMEEMLEVAKPSKPSRAKPVVPPTKQKAGRPPKSIADLRQISKKFKK